MNRLGGLMKLELDLPEVDYKEEIRYKNNWKKLLE